MNLTQRHTALGTATDRCSPDAANDDAVRRHVLRKVRQGTW